MTKAVHKLNADLARMRHAAAGEKKALAQAKSATAAEKQAKAQLAAQEQQMIDAFVAAPTTDPAQLQKLLSGVVALGTKEAQVESHFQAEIAQDKKQAAKEKKAFTHERRQALKDLKPAEYDLSLKATNRDRKELGLKPVNHAIRPAIQNVVGGQVGQWIAEAQAVLKAHGVPLSKMNPRDIAIIIKHESGGNPRAINNWDSNAAAGHPSEGLMQTIGPTFNSYKLPGHGQILNPVDNIIAGVRYAIARYGSISNVPGVRAVHAGGSYVGY